MELITYSWISSAILAPTISAICIVVLFLLNVYRGQWRNVDHFLVGLTVEEIISAILCFGLSIINLLHNRNEQLCGLLTSLWFSIRLMQLATLTSLAIDRLLILKWPYKYRFTIRSFQIKIHLIILSICCSSIAIFAYNARLDQPTIQQIINELPTSSNSNLTPNLAYFDIFSLFTNSNDNNDLLNSLTSTSLLNSNNNLDLTTPLPLINNQNKTINQKVQRINDRLALPLKLNNKNDDLQSFLSSASLSSSLINSQNLSPPNLQSSQSQNSPSSSSSSITNNNYNHQSTSHLLSSIPPPLLSTNLPISTLSMNQHNLFNKQQFSVCSLHPLFFARTFNLIFLGLFGLLSLVIVICFIYVDCVRRLNKKRRLIKQTNYLSSYLNNNKNKLTNVSILNGNLNELNNSRSLANQNLAIKQQQLNKTNSGLNNSSPGNTTTTTYTSDNQSGDNNQISLSNHKLSLNQATSLSTLAIDENCDKLNQYDQVNHDSMSALCSMIDHDLTKSTDALALSSKETKNNKKSKMNLLSKSQPSLLHNDLLINKSNLSVCSFDIELNKQRRLIDQQQHYSNHQNKLNLLNQQQHFKYSNQQFKNNRLPVRSSSMITQTNNHQLIDDNEPFTVQSREDLFSRKYLRDHYKICDLRWSSVVTCTSLCYSVNHLPTMILLVISLLMPQYWTLLNENILIWFSLIQGLLLPFCLYIADKPFKDAVRFAFRRKQQPADFKDLLFANKSTNTGLNSLPGYSFAPSSYLTALSDDFCRNENTSLLRIYQNHHNLMKSNQQLNDTKSSSNSNKLSSNHNLNALQYSISNSQKYGVNPLPFQFNQSFNNQPFNGRLPPKKLFVSSNSVNITNGYHSYANNDFLLLDKPTLNGPYSGAAIQSKNLPDPRRSSFSCFLSSNGLFPGYSTIEKKHYYSSSKLNNDLYLNNKQTAATDLLTPTIKCYQQLFANSVKFEQQLNTLNNNPISYVSNGKFQSPFNQMTKTNPVYLTNEHFLPNSRKSVAVSEIAFTGNEKEIDKFKLDQRKSLCENISFQTKESFFDNNYKQFNRQSNQQKLINKNSNNRLYDSPENSLECPLIDQLNSLASDNGDYQSLVAKNLSNKSSPNNGKFKCSRLANVGLLSNVASLAQTGVRVQSQSKMSRLLGNRKLDLKQSLNKQKQRRSFSGEINCELLNSLDSVDEDQNDWPLLIEEQEISKSDTERDGCETIWNYSIKNQANSKQQINETKLDNLSLKRPKLIVDDQLNLVDIENAIRNSTNLLNLSVFNVASDEEDQENQNIKLEELLKIKDKNNKNKKKLDDEIDDFELANDDFEFHAVKSTTIDSTDSKNENKIKESNSLNKEIKLIKKESIKQDSTKINGLFKKNSPKLNQNEFKINSNKLESDYRRKSITSITPLCSYQNKSLLNNKKQSKSVSDLTAQFENCIKNKPNNLSPSTNKKDEFLNKRSTSESNLLISIEKEANSSNNDNILPTSTALMLQLIKKTNALDKTNNQIKSMIKNDNQQPITKSKNTNSGTITRKKCNEIRKTSSSNSNCSDESSNRRYLKKDEQKINKSMLPISANNNNSNNKRLQQPPHYKFIRLSDQSYSNRSNNQHFILPDKSSNKLNLSSNTPILRKYQQSYQQSYQPIYQQQQRSPNITHNQLTNNQISNRIYQSNLNAIQKQNYLVNNRSGLVSSSKSNLTSINSMPNLNITQSNLFPFNFQ